MPTSLKRRGAPSSTFSSSVNDNDNQTAKVDIQPLRDLAKNFDIDIEPYLQEYLRVTGDDDDMEIEGNNGDDGNSSGTSTTTIKQHNFAAAALKIQNSVGIYNRKVDFLHKVVYQVFHEFIQSNINANTNNNKKNRSSSSANNNNKGGSTDAAIDAFREYDPELEFLLLDNVLPVDRSVGHVKINLKEEILGKLNNNGDIIDIDDANATGVNLDQTVATSAAGANVININGDGIGNNNNDNTPNNVNVTLLSLGGVMSATRIMDQDGTFIVGRQSLDRANQSAMSRMLLANLQGGGGSSGGGLGGNNEGEGNLRLVAGMCDMGSNGALLMPGTRASVFVNGEAAAAAAAAAAVPNGGNEEDNMQIFPGGLSPGPPHENNNIDGGDFGAMDNDASFCNNGGGNDWGDDDHGVGFQLNDVSIGDTLNNLDGEEEKKNEDGLEAADVFLNDDDDKQPPTKPKAMEDPWAVLDPHEPSRDRAQPLRIGVTYRLPPELDEDDRPSAAVTGSRTRVKKKKGSRKSEQKKVVGQSSTAANDFLAPPFLADVTFHEAMREEDEIGDGDTLDQSMVSIQPNEDGGRHLKLLQQLRQKKLIFGEEFAYVAKAHGKHREALRKQRRVEQQELWEAKQKAEERNVFDDDDREDYGGGGIDFGGGDDDDSFGGQDFGNINNDGNESIHRSNVDFNAIDDVFGTGGGGVAFDENDDDFANGAQHQTFEELCRAHLRKFANSAEVYAAETQLTKRVGAWQEGLSPLLEEQEQRPEFDIHGCGRQVLQRVERNITVRKRTSSGEKKLELSSGDKQKNNVVAFSTIFSNECEDYEVCRLFLSTLMLCNSGNVTMHKNNPNGEGIESMDSLDIELLDATFQAPMESFVAPSVEGEEFQEKENRASSSNLVMVDENIEF